MSNHLISTAYKRKLGSPLRKSVMALLADKASDDGRGIYAAKQTIADELDCSKRAVIDVIRGFIADGLLHEVGQRECTNGYTVEYRIDVAALEKLPLVTCHQRREDRCSKLTGESAAPVTEVHGRGEPAAPKPTLNPHSSSKTSSSTKKRTRAAAAVEVPDWVPADAWEGWLEMRKAKGSKETNRALTLAIEELRRLADAGHPPGAVLDQSTLRRWTGLFPLKDALNEQSRSAGRSPSASSAHTAAVTSAFDRVDFGGFALPA